MKDSDSHVQQGKDYKMEHIDSISIFSKVAGELYFAQIQFRIFIPETLSCDDYCK